MDHSSEAELEAAIDGVMNPPRAPAPAGSLVGEVKRLSHEEMARVQALAGSDEWFLEGDGQPVGPLTTAQMKERWLAHSIRPDSRCWGVGLPDGRRWAGSPRWPARWGRSPHTPS